MTILKNTLAYAIDKLGCRYSQAERMKPDVFDCSSLIYRAFLAAGYKFETDQNTSCYLVYDPNFDRLWPEAGKVLGKQFTSIAALKKQGYEPKPGDIIYLNTDSKTTRSNKITHVVMVENSTTIIHARGASYGVRRDSINLYDGKIVAVTRFREADDIEDGNTGNFLRIATCVCDTFVNIRETPNGKILGSVKDGHPLIVDGKDNDTWLTVTTLKDGKSLSGVIFRNYIKIL